MQAEEQKQGRPGNEVTVKPMQVMPAISHTPVPTACLLINCQLCQFPVCHFLEVGKLEVGNGPMTVDKYR